MARNRQKDSMVSRMIQGCKSVEVVSNMLSIHKKFSLCPAESVNYAQVRQPKLSLEAANLVHIISEGRAETDVTSRGTSMDKTVMATVRRSGNDKIVLMDRLQILRDRASTAMERFTRIPIGRTHSRKTGCLRALRAARKDIRVSIVPPRKQETDNCTLVKSLHYVQSHLNTLMDEWAITSAGCYWTAEQIDLLYTPALSSRVNGLGNKSR